VRAVNDKVDAVAAGRLEGEASHVEAEIHDHALALGRRVDHEIAAEGREDFLAVLVRHQDVDFMQSRLGAQEADARGDGERGVHGREDRRGDCIERAHDHQLAAEVLRVIAKGKDFDVHVRHPR
jgi:hypothetical protein